jgi:hypothetical protein
VDFRRYYGSSGWHAENLFKILDHALSCFFYRLIEKFFSEKAHRFLYSLVSRKIVCGGCGGEKMLKVLMDEQKQKPIFFSFIYAAPLVFCLQQDAKTLFLLPSHSTQAFNFLLNGLRLPSSFIFIMSKLYSGCYANKII